MKTQYFIRVKKPKWSIVSLTFVSIIVGFIGLHEALLVQNVLFAFFSIISITIGFSLFAIDWTYIEEVPVETGRRSSK